jgi:hypothetical protein
MNKKNKIEYVAKLLKEANDLLDLLHDHAVHIDGRDGKSEEEIGQATIDFRVTEEEIRDVYSVIEALCILETDEEIINKIEAVGMETTNELIYNIMKELKYNK